VRARAQLASVCACACMLWLHRRLALVGACRL